MNRDKILVIGGSGFLGSHVSDSLTQHGHDVTIFDQKESPYLSSNQKFIQGSFLDKDKLDDSISKNDYVFHFGGIADIKESSLDPIKTISSNVMGTSYILESCEKNNIKKFIFSSSIYVFSKLGSFYSVSKRACEDIIRTYQSEHSLPFVIARYGSLYGPRAQSWNGLQKYVQEILDKKSISYVGSGEEKRDYIHVQDAANISSSLISEKYLNTAVYISGHQTLTSSELLSMIFEICGEEEKIKFENINNDFHYKISPYSYDPLPSIKIIPDNFIDLGQGILELISSFDK